MVNLILDDIQKDGHAPPIEEYEEIHAFGGPSFANLDYNSTSIQK